MCKLSSSLANSLSRFTADSRGQVAIIFGISGFALMLAAGIAVDYISNSNRQAEMQGRMDAAVLAGIAQAREALDAGESNPSARKKAEAAAKTYYAANGADPKDVASFSLSQNGLDLTLNGTVTGERQNLFMGMVGDGKTSITVKATASTGSSGYQNVYLLVDTSASMLLPSTSAGIDAMKSGTGCALACHDNPGSDSYAYAQSHGIKLRYHVVAEGIQEFIDYLQTSPTIRTHTKLGLWSFDHALHEVSELTTNFNSVLDDYPDPTVAVDEYLAATEFDKLSKDFVDLVGKGYAEGTPDKPKKLVILASDGVNDPTRAWTHNASLRAQVRAFNMKFCKDLQKNGVTVAIINTPYLPMTWDWGYNVTLGQSGNKGGNTRVDDIPLVLEDCAGELFTIAEDEAAIRNSFKAMFQRSFATRLSN